jgi:hypothetical protein
MPHRHDGLQVGQFRAQRDCLASFQASETPPHHFLSWIVACLIPHGHQSELET